MFPIKSQTCHMRQKYSLNFEVLQVKHDDDKYISLQKSVLYMGVRLYKHLSLKIKRLVNFNRFKKEVKLTSPNNSFNTLEEFLQAKLV